MGQRSLQYEASDLTAPVFEASDATARGREASEATAMGREASVATVLGTEASEATDPGLEAELITTVKRIQVEKASDVIAPGLEDLKGGRDNFGVLDLIEKEKK